MAAVNGLGAVLRIEVIGWDGPPPALPMAPMKVYEGRGGQQTFYYDFSPKEANLDVAQMCTRLSTRLARALLGEKTPFADKPVAVRAALDVGVIGPAGVEKFSYSWPVEFLQTLADAEIELSVTHYMMPADEGDGGPESLGLIVED
jgi:hypothetical protein